MDRHRHVSRALTLGVSVAASVVLLGTAATSSLGGGDDREVALDISRIFFEYNSSANDLGVHVFLDGEDWKKLKIIDPKDNVIFEVAGKGPYSAFGMTELFFEGAEPSLEDVPLAVLLAKFPAGEYEFEGKTVDGEEIEGEGVLSHAIPAGPNVAATLSANDHLVINWSAVNAPPPGFPVLPVKVVSYQVIVGSFQVTLPATRLSVTVPPELVAALDSGVHDFEVLAIEASGNQTITEGTFVKP